MIKQITEKNLLKGMFNKKIINKSAFLWFEFLSKRFGPGPSYGQKKNF